ncbi:probable LRR receptor-like serine/threonine-protein kinase At3g47570 [Mangifera indica]|uniref:probable LRR receptor-like serine/threonine-protein kinase At3g47570 n=1 Tax=Mangifera indica TaxID=29780 RepID=UPI001CFA508A|nr:probable LRR receptor-like serine/threonine-protein kinase At3g47570 [Mangifera indica]
MYTKAWPLMEKNLSLRSLLVAYFVQFSTLSFVTAKQTNIFTDQQALLALKAHITHDPTNLLSTNWSSATSACNWIGIRCGARHHRVTALNISYFHLTATLPPQLGNLSFLSSLSIQNNSFHGAIPDELARLRQLKHLQLSNNNFNNIEIPLWLGSLTKLQLLGLNEVKFSGTIPEALGNLSSLEGLHLDYNQLSGSIPTSIFNISSLQVLSLYHSQLSGSFPSIFFNMPYLVRINLGDNGLSGGLTETKFDNLPSLEVLYLDGNMFTGQIPSNLSGCRSLQSLALSHNYFTGAMPKEIGKLSQLKNIFIGHNRLQGEIPKELGNCTQLESLILANNQLTGAIPKDIGNLIQLSLIYLDYNNIQGPLPKEIGNLTQLQYMFISGNKLQGMIYAIGCEIPSEIGNLHNLQYLVLNFNNLVGVVPTALFNISMMKHLSVVENKLSFSGFLSSNIQLPNLKGLHLGSNCFSGRFPNFVFNSSKLFILDISENSFSDFIPDTTGNLRNLGWLVLSDNFLTSYTPNLSFLSSLTLCRNLKYLELNGNPLNGILPSSIGNLSISLESIHMNDCNISGNIPREIKNLKNLIDLQLENNELIGSIPVTLGGLQKLQGLNLGNNKLKGSIPDDLCGLNKLRDLQLDGNKIFGSIPACVGNLTTLNKLSLAFNRLASFIPSTLWQLENMLYFNLSSNFLNGSLPLEIEALKVVINIDLSRNLLSGNIPNNIGRLKNLQNLSLGWNRIEGSIPESIGEMTSLVFLDLSSNNLSGDIPISLEKLMHLKYLNLSFNRLSGKIPEKGSFGNFSTKSFMGNLALCGSPKLQVPTCKTNSPRKLRAKKVIILIVLPLSIVVTILILTFVLTKTLKKSTKPPTNVEMSPHHTWRRISYQELMKATDGFNENNLLGRGSYGSVYKGRLDDGMDLAVKVFHLHFDGAIKSFKTECELLSSFRHRNLVKVISSCTNEDFKGLILEYMPNGSLEKCLYSKNIVLDISQRLNIMIDVALGLEYLHFGCPTFIVHCDLKPNNVLIDENLVAHLSDFGIAKLLGEEDSMTLTQTVATIGYMAPEYGREGKISRKGDVYSYGIILMETFTRKKPTDEIFTGEKSLRSWVGESLSSTVMQVLDTNLLRRDDEHFSSKEACVSSILSLAMECTRESPLERITIEEVAIRLIKIRVQFAKLET